MNHFNKKTTLNLQLVASILIFLVYSCNNENSTHLSNEFRKQNSIPIIEKEWTTKKIKEREIIWGVYQENNYTPYHLNKTLKYNKLDTLISEEDCYLYKMNDSLELRLVYIYSYNDKTTPWSCELYRYKKRQVELFGKKRIASDVESEYISLKKADSILNSWNLSR